MGRFYNPVDIVFGEDSIKRLTPSLISQEAKNNRTLILIGSNSLRKSGNLDIILNQLGSMQTIIHEGVPSNPDITDLLEIKRGTDLHKYDSIIAIGGGSVIDTGKALKALKYMQIDNLEHLREIIEKRHYSSNDTKCQMIAIPTTAGTGSEVTCWSTIWDRNKALKYSIEDRSIFPNIAIIDPNLTLNLSVQLTATTALDALCHAVEAYWAKNSNEITRYFSLMAIENISNNVLDLLDNPLSMNLRSKVANGSLYAGLAFSNTKTTACHSISYPLTLLYGINHGIATSITLSKVLELNKDYIIDLDKLLQAFGAQNINDIEYKIKEIYSKANFSNKLRDFGVAKIDLCKIAQQSITPGRMDNNPRNITSQDVLILLNRIF